MQFNLGYLKSAHQVSIKMFNIKEQTVEEKLIDVMDLNEENLQAMFFTSEFQDHEVMSTLQNYTKYYPLLKTNNLSYDTFQTLTVEAGLKLAKEQLAPTLIKNNLNTLGEIFALSAHLKTLWAKDRYAFFHEVWFLMRTNLACPEVKIIFHDVLEKESESADVAVKHKLIFSTLNGNIKANIEQSKTPEVELYKHYEAQFNGAFQVAEYYPEKGDLLILSSLEKSPIMIMAKTFEFNQLQQTLLATLFKSIA